MDGASGLECAQARARTCRYALARAWTPDMHGLGASYHLNVLHAASVSATSIEVNHSHRRKPTAQRVEPSGYFLSRCQEEGSPTPARPELSKHGGDGGEGAIGGAKGGNVGKPPLSPPPHAQHRTKGENESGPGQRNSGQRLRSLSKKLQFCAGSDAQPYGKELSRFACRGDDVRVSIES